MKKVLNSKVSTDGKSAEILIYGYISSYGSDYGYISAKEFIEMIQALETSGVESFTVRINSGGGEVFDGLSIFNYLRERNVTVIIDGLAASIASIIALSGKTVKMKKGTFLMIHNPWSWDGGDAAYLKKVAETLDQIKDSLAQVYMDKTGLSKDEISTIMNDESWLSAQFAKDKKFIDEIIDDSVLKNVKTLIVNLMNGIYETPNQEKGNNMNVLAILRNLFGISNTVTDDNVTAEVKNKYDAVSNELTAAKSRVTTLEVENTSLLERVTAFENAEKTVKANRISAVLDAAVASHKINASERKVWENALMDDEEGNTKILNSKTPGSLNRKVEKPETKNSAEDRPVVKASALKAAEIIRDQMSEK